MKKQTTFHYDPKTDALWIKTKNGAEVDSQEIAPGITVEYGEHGEVIGFEILRASQELKQFTQLAKNNRYQQL